jgi:transposase
MKPYSQDLRERVMTVVNAGQQSLSEIAQVFGISASTVDKWCKRQRDTGSVAARPFAGGRRRVLQECGAMIRAAVKKQPDVSLAELCERIQATHGIHASPSMMCRELHRLKLPLKKSRSMTANARRLA